MSEPIICPNCGTPGMTTFYNKPHAPAHSVLLLTSREEAVNYPTGDIELGFCESCGFVSNVRFDPALNEYDARYEGTQSFSPTFSAFAKRQAQRIIDRFDLHGKDVIEIGCGQGEFLIQLCELGENRGIGFDPAYRSDQSIDSPARDRLTFIADFYTEKYVDHHGDFVCCKMTLEHIDQTADFVRTVRRSVGDRPDTIVQFQIPNAAYVLQDVAFWDVYYEHCSYFTPVSLMRLFSDSGFDVLDVYTEYDDQYLVIESKPSKNAVGATCALEYDLEAARRDVAFFEKVVQERLAMWREIMAKFAAEDKKVVLWGGGSKGVAFLTTLDLRKQVEYVVDINPNKRDTYMAGTGQEIVLPETMKTYRPDVVIVMNPVYCDEIQASLDAMGLDAKLLPVSITSMEAV